MTYKLNKALNEIYDPSMIEGIDSYIYATSCARDSLSDLKFLDLHPPRGPPSHVRYSSSDLNAPSLIVFRNSMMI